MCFGGHVDSLRPVKASSALGSKPQAGLCCGVNRGAAEPAGGMVPAAQQQFQECVSLEPTPLGTRQPAVCTWTCPASEDPWEPRRFGHCGEGGHVSGHSRATTRATTWFS